MVMQRRPEIFCMRGFLFFFVFPTCQMIRFQLGPLHPNSLRSLANDNQSKHSLISILHIQNERIRNSTRAHASSDDNSFHRESSAASSETADSGLHRRETSASLDLDQVSHDTGDSRRHLSHSEALVSPVENHSSMVLNQRQSEQTRIRVLASIDNRASYLTSRMSEKMPARQPVPYSNSALSKRDMPSRQPVSQPSAVLLRQSMPSRQPVPQSNTMRSRQPVPSRRSFPETDTVSVHVRSKPRLQFRRLDSKSVHHLDSSFPSRKAASQSVKTRSRQPSRSRQTVSQEVGTHSHTDAKICLERERTLFPDNRPSRQPFPSKEARSGKTTKQVRRNILPNRGSRQRRLRKRQNGIKHDDRIRTGSRYTSRFVTGARYPIDNRGACSTLCSNLCVFGYDDDAAGCQTCTCRRSALWTCSQAYCSLPCPFGYEHDAFGCGTCTCTFKLLMDYLRGMLTQD